MIPSSSERRKTIRVSLMISRRWSEGTSGSNIAVRDSLVSRASRTLASNGARSSLLRSVQVSGLNGHPVPEDSTIHGGTIPPDSPCVMPHSATARSVNSETVSVSLKSSRGAERRMPVSSTTSFDGGAASRLRAPASGMRVNSATLRPKHVGNHFPEAQMKWSGPLDTRRIRISSSLT